MLDLSTSPPHRIVEVAVSCDGRSFVTVRTPLPPIDMMRPWKPRNYRDDKLFVSRLEAEELIQRFLGP